MVNRHRHWLALGVLSALALAACSSGGSSSESANGDVVEGSAALPSECGELAVVNDATVIECTWEDASATVDGNDFVSQINAWLTDQGYQTLGSTDPVWVQSWGAGGGASDTGNTCTPVTSDPEGLGGDGGYAQTLRTVGDISDATLYAYVGEAGNYDNEVCYGGGGGAAGLMTTAPITSGSFDFATDMLVIAGGGGGGGAGCLVPDTKGQTGGVGNTAIATSSSAVSVAGGSGHGRGGTGGNTNQSSTGDPDGGADADGTTTGDNAGSPGIGGTGGTGGDGKAAGGPWLSPSSVDSGLSTWTGGQGGNGFGGDSDGGGGGGYGGGGGGKACSGISDDSGGGGGGGSYAAGTTTTDAAAYTSPPANPNPNEVCTNDNPTCKPYSTVRLTFNLLVSAPSSTSSSTSSTSSSTTSTTATTATIPTSTSTAPTSTTTSTSPVEP